MGDRPSAIVVGAGVFGAAVADALARRGWEVTIVERYAPANARGSSGDRTRLIRAGHGSGPADDWYTRSAMRSLELWRALGEERGVELLRRTGLVWFEREDDAEVRAIADGLARAGVEHERLERSELASMFGDLGVDDLAGGLFEPEAAVIRATAAVEALLARAADHGARLVLDHAEPRGPGAVAVAERELGADAVVWACGAWLGSLFGDEAPVRPAWQDVLHWHCPPEWRDGPAWFDGGADLYGFPDVDGLGVKALAHAPGRTFDPDRDDRRPDDSAIASVADYISRRFPALAGAGVLWARVMPYEVTPDNHFIAGASTARQRHWLIGGGSGHGFKHAPVLGEHLADLVEDRGARIEAFAPGPRNG